MQLPRVVGAVVFDFDGLLADTESAWHRAEAALFAARGLRFGAAERAACTGRSAADVVAVLLHRFGLPADRGLEVEAELLAAVEAQAPQPPRAMPGAIELVRSLAGRVPLGIASNSSRPALDENLAAVGLQPYFDVTVSADDVEAPKPHPGCYLDAFRGLGAAATDGVAFEDSDTGAAAASASGAFVVAVPPRGRTSPAGQHRADSLAAPELLQWAALVRTRRLATT